MSDCVVFKTVDDAQQDFLSRLRLSVSIRKLDENRKKQRPPVNDSDAARPYTNDKARQFHKILLLVNKNKFSSSKKNAFFLVQQVESFPLSLPSTSSNNILLEAKDSNSIVMAADCHLFLYSLKGALLASFKEHTMPITSLCVVRIFEAYLLKGGIKSNFIL